MKAIFREALSSEAPFLTQLALDSNAIYHYRTVSDNKAREVLGLTEKDFKQGLIQIMEINSEVIGFFSLIQKMDEKNQMKNYLGHLFLKPIYIGQGYGRLLFHKAMSVTKHELKWTTIQWVSDPNAAGFYLKMGAYQIGKNPCLLNPKGEVPIFSFDLKNLDLI